VRGELPDSDRGRAGRDARLTERREIYCPGCEAFRPLVREALLPASCVDLVEGKVGDLVCGACHLVIATLRTVRTVREPGVVEGFRRGERSRA